MSAGEEEYRTIGTTYYAGYATGEEFDELVNSGIAEKYDTGKIEARIINGDGASWTSAECEEDANSIYQLDLFHIYSKASKKVKDKKDREELYKLIREGQWDKLVARSKELWEKAEEKEKENLKEVYDYYNNNRKALERYWNRLSKEILSKVPGEEIRGMGTMESSIHNTLGDRMKGVAWSTGGADAIAKALSVKHSDDGDDVMIKIVYGKNDGLSAKGIITKLMRKKMNETKREVGNAVKEIIKETKRKRKYCCVNSHITALDGKVTQLTTTLKELINNPA